MFHKIKKWAHQNKAGEIALLLIIMLCLIFPFSEAEAIRIENPLRAETFRDLIEIIIDFLIMVAVVVAPLMIIIGAFYFVVSAGHPEHITMGRKIITYALVGLVIVLLAKGLIVMLERILIESQPPLEEEVPPTPDDTLLIPIEPGPELIPGPLPEFPIIIP